MASVRKPQAVRTEEAQLQLLYGDESSFKYWQSHLFNEVYLRRDLPERQAAKWDGTESLGFQHFQNTLRNLAEEYRDRDKELSNWSETETINNWVKHVLDGLGWKDNCSGVQNPFLEETSFRYDSKTYRTDILIVDHPKEKQYINQATGEEKLVEARNSVIMPIEVKYWQRLEEFRQGQKEETDRRDNETDELERTATPNEQIVRYMSILKKDWGILTDGARWRLFNRDLSSEDANRFYEFNLFSLVQSLVTEQNENDRKETLEASKYFYHFFSKETFYSKNDGEESFVDEIVRYSKKYVNKVEEDLKDRFVKAMNIACNAIQMSGKTEKTKIELGTIRNIAESALFNILFTKSLESRDILPMSATDYKKISLSSIVDKIEKFDPDKDDVINCRELERAFKRGNGNSFSYDPKGTELHDRIVRLTDIINKGAAKKDNFGFEIEGFRESVFSSDEWNLFKSCRISNHDWVRILFELGYAESESMSRKYQQIPYSFFTPRQLGSIYESFLEFKLDQAKDDMVFEKRQWIKANVNSPKYKNRELPTVKRTELFFTPDNEDRKATGSYYTPHYAVEKVVQSTLLPLVKGKSAEEICQLRVCDPAMGSGHFISAALNFLSRAYLANIGETAEADIDFNETLRTILKSCIFGIDINPRAVKLAKMSLWLTSATPAKKLEDLSAQLVCADSLSSQVSVSKAFPQFKKGKMFDAIVGNPPWVFCKYHDFNLQNKANWPKHLVAATGKVNLYSLFLERSFDFLDEGGVVSFLLPNTVLRITTQKKLRAKLVSEYSILEIVDFGEGVFEDVTASTISISIKKDKKSSHQFKVLDFKKKWSHVVDSSSISDATGFVYPGAMDEGDLEVIELIEGSSGSHLLDKFIFMNGVATKSGKAGMSSKKEDARYKRTLEGKDIAPYKWTFKSKYICYDKKFLECARDEEKFLAKWKIVGQRITGGTQVMTWALDDNQHYTFNSINNLIPKDFNDPLKNFYLAYLNSDLVNKYMCVKFTNKSKLTVNMSKAFLECLPLPTEIDADMLKTVNWLVQAQIEGKDRRSEIDELIVNYLKKKSGKSKKRAS